MGREARSFGESAGAPLLFTRHTVVIAVHFDTGAVLQEERGFGARSHLGTIGATIAMKRRRRCLIAGRDGNCRLLGRGRNCRLVERGGNYRLDGRGGNCRLWCNAPGVLAVTVGGQKNDKDKENGPAEDTLALAAAAGH